MDNVCAETELTQAKQIFRHNCSETKILTRYRLEEDFRKVICRHTMKEKTARKKSTTSELVSVYDDLIALISPSPLTRKITFREIYNLKLSWDETLSTLVKQKWQ